MWRPVTHSWAPDFRRDSFSACAGEALRSGVVTVAHATGMYDSSGTALMHGCSVTPGENAQLGPLQQSLLMSYQEQS